MRATGKMDVARMAGSYRKDREGTVSSPSHRE